MPLFHMVLLERDLVQCFAGYHRSSLDLALAVSVFTFTVLRSASVLVVSRLRRFRCWVALRSRRFHACVRLFKRAVRWPFS